MTVASAHRALGMAVDHEAREQNDFYPTPPEGTQALLSVETFSGPIWEPACGDGAISHVLQAAGYEVHSTDLVDRGYGESRIDFLMEWQPRAPNIVTNPPFKLSTQFVDKALSLTTGKVAMLGRLAWLEGVERYEKLYSRQPIARVHVFSKRLSMQRGRQSEESDAGGMIPFAWFVWDHSHTGKPTLGWL